MQISAKVDYAVRALLELASRDALTTTDELAKSQDLPKKFVEAILGDLRRAQFVRSQRGAVGGYTLARPANEITIGQVMRAVDGRLAVVRGLRPDQMTYEGTARNLPEIWVAVRAALRRVLDETTIADILSGEYPEHVQELMKAEDAWLPR